MYKPSEHSSLVGSRLVELLRLAGVPRDLVQLILGAGDAGKALLQHHYDGVNFIGSFATPALAYRSTSRVMRRLDLFCDRLSNNGSLGVCCCWCHNEPRGHGAGGE